MTVSPANVKKVLLVAALLAIPALVALPAAHANDSQPHVAMTPEFFRVSTGFTATLTVSELVAVKTVKVTIPEGVTLSAAPVLPPGWLIREQFERLYSFDLVDGNVPPASVSFDFPIATAPCANDFQALGWQVKILKQGEVEDTPTPSVQKTATHWCDKKAPRVHVALPATTTSTAGKIVLVSADETASSIKKTTIDVTYANGATQQFSAAATTVEVTVDPLKLGAWTYRVTMEDKAGNVVQDPATGLPPRETFVVDATAPTATLTAAGPQEAGKPTLVQHSSADNSGVTWSTLHWRTGDNDAWNATNVTGQATTESIVVNDHLLKLQLYLNVTDPTGNGVEKFVNLTFKDSFAPTLAYAVTPDAPDGSWRTAAPSKVTLDAADAGAPRSRLKLNYTVYTTTANETVDGTPQSQVDLAPPFELVLPPIAATHVIHWAAKDDKNNVNETQTRIVRVDPNAPTAQLENHSDAWYTVPIWITFKPAATYSGLDHAPTKTSWAVDNATQPQWSARFATDGVRWLTWTATSNASVAASGPGAKLHVDTTAPTLAIQLSSASPGSSGLYAADVTYTLVASDPTSGVAQLTHALDGATQAPYAAPVTVTTDGVHTVVAKARNAAGLETTQSVTFTIDRAAPTLAIRLNNSLTANSLNHSAVVTVQASDTTSVTVACSVDGIPFNHASGVTVSTNGIHAASCQATDVAGNVANVTRTFRVDRSAPVVTPRGDLGFVRLFDGAVTIQDLSAVKTVHGWLVSASGEGRVVGFTEGAGDVWTGAAPSGLTDGRYALSVLAADEFGRSSDWVEVLSFHLLTVAPQAEVYVPGGYDKGWLTKAEVTWKMLPHPAPAQMLVRVDNGAEAVGAQPFVITKTGHTNVTFRTRDSAGNLGEPVAYTFVIAPPSTGGGGGGTTPPPANRAPGVGGVTLAVQGDRVVATPGGVSDADGDIVQLTYRWRVNGADVSGATGPSVAAVSGQRVQVLVTPFDGKVFGATVESAVLDVPFDNPPVARFSFTGQPRVGAPLALDASASSGGLPPLSYSWSFSDGGSATGARVSHSFIYVGDGHAELTVTDARGATGKLRRDFQVAQQEIRREDLYSWRAPDGTTHVLEGELATRVTLLRELPGSALLLETPGGMALWRPPAGTRDPVHGVGAAPGDPRYESRAQVIPFSVPATAGWALAKLADPQPGLPPADLVEEGGGAPTWWRDDFGIHVLTRARALELRYALPELALTADVRPVPGQPGDWTVVLTATGGGPVQSLRLMQGERVLAEEAGRTLRVVHTSLAAATLGGIVRTDDGQQATARVSIPATQTPPTATPTTGGTPTTTPGTPPGDGEDDDGNPMPAPGVGLVALALAGVALALAGRRRRA